MNSFLNFSFQSPNNEEERMPLPSEEETDRLFAETLNELPMKERDEALHDIHGVSDLPQETPELISEKLNELDDALDKLDIKNAYEIAKSVSNEYVSDRKLRLKFLRSDSYNTQKAAVRLAAHFKLKLELFGEDTLVREILLSDLDPEEIEAFKSGYVQLLPQRDRAGRSIFFLDRASMPELSVQTRQRLFWYLGMSSLDDEETQVRGVVFIYYAIGESGGNYSRGNASKMTGIMRALPLRLVGIHGCCDDDTLRLFFRLAAFLVESATRVRLRYHFGTHLEVQYALMTFGIPRVVLPIDSQGNLGTECHQKWLAVRSQQEFAMVAVESRIVVPGPFDVLMGRGKTIEENPGNLRLRHLINTYAKRYNAATKFEKTVVAEAILGIIKDSGGRVVKHGETGWKVVSLDLARDKISHAFRNKRSRSSQRPRSSKTTLLQHFTAPMPAQSSAAKRLRR